MWTVRNSYNAGTLTKFQQFFIPLLCQLPTPTTPLDLLNVFIAVASVFIHLASASSPTQPATNICNVASQLSVSAVRLPALHASLVLQCNERSVKPCPRGTRPVCVELLRCSRLRFYFLCSCALTRSSCT